MHLMRNTAFELFARIAILRTAILHFVRNADAGIAKKPNRNYKSRSTIYRAMARRGSAFSSK